VGIKANSNKAYKMHKDAMYSRKYYRLNREHILKTKRLRRAKLLAEGKCPKCAGLLIDDERIYCSSCLSFAHIPISML